MPFSSIFVPDFAVEALLRIEPDLRSQPLAVLEGKVPMQTVFAVNEQARNLGIAPGMSKIQAEACPQLSLRPRSLLQEAAAHAALLDCAQSFSPRVEDTGTDIIVLDLAGLEPLFGPLPKIARDLARRASDLGLECNVAVAASPDAAVLAARGFSGVTVIPPGCEADQLGVLPVTVLFPADDPQSEEWLTTLSRWGIHKFRELAALPEIALSERLGQKGLYFQKLARGAITRTLVPVESPLIFEEAVELESPIVLLEPLAFLLSRLLEQICARLNSRALATQELRLQLELASGYSEAESDLSTALVRDQQFFQRTLHLPVPLLDPKTFLKLLQLDLRAHPPGAPILKIRLTAEPVRPRASQSGLFVPPSPEPEKLELTLARIAGIVGEDKVGSLEILDTHRREGFRMQRFGKFFSSRRRDETKNSSAQSRNPPRSLCDDSNDLVTAMRILRPPVSAIVTMPDGRPTHIACRTHKEFQGEVLWAAGPWRSSGDWWELHAWCRDEWDIAVQTTAGIALFRLVRDVLAGRWFLEGMYD